MSFTVTVFGIRTSYRVQRNCVSIQTSYKAQGKTYSPQHCTKHMDTIIITKLQKYTYLFLPCDEIPVVNQPLSQLLWYVHLDLLVRGGLTLHRKYNTIYTNRTENPFSTTIIVCKTVPVLTVELSVWSCLVLLARLALDGSASVSISSSHIQHCSISL